MNRDNDTDIFPLFSVFVIPRNVLDAFWWSVVHVLQTTMLQIQLHILEMWLIVNIKFDSLSPDLLHASYLWPCGGKTRVLPLKEDGKID